MRKIVSQDILNTIEKGPIYRSLFHNGSTILYHHAKGFSGCKVKIHFLAGTIFEDPKLYGVAHLVEHLCFKEIDSDIVRELELMGADINAYTDKENVCFELDCPSRLLSKALFLFLDLILNLEFSDLQFKQEKKVILQELKEDLNDHETQAIETLFAKNFPSDVGHPTGGNPLSVKKLKPEDALLYYSKFFKPNRMIIAICSGKNDNKNILKTYENYVGDKKAKPFRLKLSKKSNPLEVYKSKQKKPIETAIYFRTYNAPTLNHKDYISLAILDEYLFEGLSSKFFIKLREENPLVYGLGSSINSYNKASQYLMSFNTQNINIKKLKLILDSVFLELGSKLIDNKIIDDIKNRFLDSYDISFDDLESRIDFMVDNEIYNKVLIDRKKLIKELSTVSSESIRHITKKYLLDKNYSELIYLKK